jgi:hypothetical protein
VASYYERMHYVGCLVRQSANLRDQMRSIGSRAVKRRPLLPQLFTFVVAIANPPASFSGRSQRVAMLWHNQTRKPLGLTARSADFARGRKSVIQRMHSRYVGADKIEVVKPSYRRARDSVIWHGDPPAMAHFARVQVMDREVVEWYWRPDRKGHCC